MTAPLGYVPDWPIPDNVAAFVTYRSGGYSEGPYHSNNLAGHIGDDPVAVARNREQVCQHLDIGRPYWLTQVHGVAVVTVDDTHDEPRADASTSDQRGQICAVLTADCLPLLICDRRGLQVGAVHCGWRGLAGGIIDRALASFSAKPGDLLAYLGPAISGAHYEVGEEVRHALANTPATRGVAVSRNVVGKPGHYLLDLYAVARAQLASAGVTAIHGGERCTFLEAEAFFSYRRDGITGRMASLIWLK